MRRLPGVTHAGIALLLSSPSRITSLSLLSNPSLGDSALREVARGRATRSSLAFFGMTFSFTVTNTGFSELISSIPSLDELQIDHCADVGDGWMRCVAGSGGLTRVSLRSVPLMLSEMSFVQLANDGAGGSRLEALNLGFVASVDAGMLRGLRLAAPKLEVLVLDACGAVDDEAMEVLGTFEKLHTLDVSWCGHVTAKGVEALGWSLCASRLRRLSVGPVAVRARDAAAQLAAVAGGPGGDDLVGINGGAAEVLDVQGVQQLEQPQEQQAEGQHAAQQESLDEAQEQQEAGPEPAIEEEAESEQEQEAEVESDEGEVSEAEAEESQEDENELEPSAGPLLADYFGMEAGDFANALDLVVHEEDVEPDLAFMAATSATADEGAAGDDGNGPAGGDAAADGVPPYSQTEVDAALRHIGLRCSSLLELNLCGAVSRSTVEWLKANTRARIDYVDMANGISSSIYGNEE